MNSSWEMEIGRNGSGSCPFADFRISDIEHQVPPTRYWMMMHVMMMTMMIAFYTLTKTTWFTDVRKSTGYRRLFRTLHKGPNWGVTVSVRSLEESLAQISSPIIPISLWASRLGAGRPVFDSQRGEGIWLFTTASRPALGLLSNGYQRLFPWK
jgi:hypothetical protein